MERILIVVMLCSICVKLSVQQECSVLSNCGEEDPDTWKSRNINELISTKSEEEMKIFFYTRSLTWQTSKTFCEALDRELCGSSNLCESSGGGNMLKVNVIPGDNWVPVSDSPNEWVEIGDDRKRTCFVHSQRYGKPAWGTSTVEETYKGYVYCCMPRASKQNTVYQYIGKTATYASSQAHCEKQGLRLCYSHEVCVNNQPMFGIVKGDNWVAVTDSENEWVEIGDDGGRTCYIHNEHYSAPPWGIRTDESLVNHVGYVICCSDN